MKLENLGGGVSLFRDAIKIDKEWLIPNLVDMRKNVILEDFTIIHDENGIPVHAINRSGHRYEVERIDHVNRITNLLMNDLDGSRYEFFRMCEETIYNSLLMYIEQYPMILPSLWWKEQGHVVAYSPGSAMGLHSDNDVNYQPNAVPDLQLATRHVVGCIIYLNDSIEVDEYKNDSNDYVGGEIEFIYLGIKHKPMSGDLLIFPSNYLATHEVLDILSGYRFAYISYFSHGSEDIARGISPAGPSSGQVWVPEIFEDYKNYLSQKYGHDLTKNEHLTLPLGRINTSSGTLIEKEQEHAKRSQ
jgi:hypothetical protein